MQPDRRSMDAGKANCEPDHENHRRRHHHHRRRHQSRGSGDHDDSGGGLEPTEEEEEEEEEEEAEDRASEEVQGHSQQDEVRELAMVALSLLKQEVKVMLHQVKQLVKSNSQIASQVFTADVEGWTPIHACALRGKKKVLKAMMRSGIDVNVRMGQPEGLPASCTLLHIAANRQDKKIVDYLLHHGAEVNAGDSYGRTPLFYAYRSGNKDAAKLLLENGARSESVGDGDSVTPSPPTSATTTTTPPDVRVEEVRTSISDDLVLETPEPKMSRFCFLPLPQHHHHNHHRQNRHHHRGQRSFQNTNGHRTS